MRRSVPLRVSRQMLFWLGRVRSVRGVPGLGSLEKSAKNLERVPLSNRLRTCQ